MAMKADDGRVRPAVCKCTAGGASLQVPREHTEQRLARGLQAGVSQAHSHRGSSAFAGVGGARGVRGTLVLVSANTNTLGVRAQ